MSRPEGKGRLSQLSTLSLLRNAAVPEEKITAVRRDVGVARATTYRPEIDGLRAIAVTSVLLFHADIAATPGGFVGVDIFFVISGYLIMTTLAADIRARRFSVLAFYERRIRRIFPALFAAAAFSTLAAGVLFPPADFARFGQSLAAMALFSSNLLFCFDSAPAGYFADGSATQMLLHTWSLAVEEQFYIFLPIGLALLRRRPERATMAWLAAIAALSFALSIWMVRAWPTGAFYLVLPRAWELLVGSLLALGLVPRPTSTLWREIEAAAGLALVVAPIFLYGKDTPFPGAAALPPCLGACLIIHATTAGRTLAGRLLATRPFVGVGLISYSLYLWHWPIAVIVKALNMGKLNAPTTIAIIVASFLAGFLSWRFVERPFRGKRALPTRRGLLTAGALAGGTAIAVGLIVGATAGLPQRFDARTLALVKANAAREGDHPDGACENFRKDVRAPSDITLCPIGAEPRKVLFWGDSLVGGLQPLVERLHREGALGGRGAIFAVSAGCTPSLTLNQNKPGYHCDAFTRAAFERAQAADVDTVLIGFSTWWATVDGGLCEVGADGCTPLGRRAEQDRVLGELRAVATTLRAAGKRLVLSLPSPIYSLSIPQMQIDAALLGPAYDDLRRVGLARRLSRNDYGELRARIAEIAAATGATLYDPLASLCTGASCTYQRDGVSIYSDTIHVAEGEIGIFHDGLAAALRTSERR